MRILQGDKAVDMALFRFFLTGALRTEEGAMPNPAGASGWLAEKSWNDVLTVESFEGFAGLSGSIAGNLSAWQRYYDAARPELEALPAPWQEKLNTFQRMTLLRIFRPDAAVSCVQSFVAEKMEQKYIEPPARPALPRSWVALKLTPRLE